MVPDPSAGPQAGGKLLDEQQKMSLWSAQAQAAASRVPALFRQEMLVWASAPAPSHHRGGRERAGI